MSERSAKFSVALNHGWSDTRNDLLSMQRDPQEEKGSNEIDNILS